MREYNRVDGRGGKRKLAILLLGLLAPALVHTAIEQDAPAVYR
jgi:hypothetical protein